MLEERLIISRVRLQMGEAFPCLTENTTLSRVYLTRIAGRADLIPDYCAQGIA